MLHTPGAVSSVNPKRMELASDRKKRLAAMRQSAGAVESSAKAVKESSSDTDAASETKIKFRNYAPYDATLEAAFGSPQNNAALDEESSAKRQKGPSGRAVEKEKKSEAADIIKQELEKQQESGGGPSVLVHKKVDHDLKLLVAGKLHKLQKRTHRAIVDLMREKLSAAAPDG